MGASAHAAAAWCQSRPWPRWELACRILLYTGGSERIESSASLAVRHRCTLPPEAAPPATERASAASSTELRLITERPLTFSSLSYASAVHLPACRFPVPDDSFSTGPSVPPSRTAEAACLEALQARRECHRYGASQACAPLEPLLGAAALAVPRQGGYMVFGGRAAVEQTRDPPECVQRLPERSAFRFQYHAELEAAVTVSTGNVTTRALRLLLSRWHTHARLVCAPRPLCY